MLLLFGQYYDDNHNFNEYNRYSAKQQIDKRYKCDAIGCDKAFVRKTDLKVHKLRVHTDIKPFICSVPNCDKVCLFDRIVAGFIHSHMCHSLN